MASALYDPAKKLLLDADLDLLVHDIRCVLLTSGYTFSAAHQYATSLGANRVGTPQTLANKSTTDGVFDADDAVFSSVTGSACTAIALYRHVTNDADSPLLAYIDGISVTPNGGNITVQWDNGTNKILKLG
jgi:hypothetical protein